MLQKRTGWCVLILAFFCSGMVSGPADADQEGEAPKEFHSKEGNYKVTFPAKPGRKVQTLPAKALAVFELATDDNANVFAVAHIDYPAGYVKDMGAKKIANGIFAGVARQPADQAKENKEIKVGAHKGWECTIPFMAKGLEGTTYARIVIVGDRVYMQMVMTFKGREPNRKAIDAFMASLKILDAE